MSIHDFYSKLSVGQEDNSLLGSLRRLSSLEDAAQVTGGTSGGPLGDWGTWMQVHESEDVVGA